MGTHVCDYGIRVSHSIVHDGWSWHEVAASMTRGPGTKKRILSRVKIYLGLKLLTVKKVKTDFYLFLSANNKSYLPPTIAVLWIQPEDIFFSSFPEHEYWHKRKTTTMFHSIPIPSASPTPPPSPTSPLPDYTHSWRHTCTSRGETACSDPINSAPYTNNFCPSTICPSCSSLVSGLSSMARMPYQPSVTSMMAQLCN